MASIIPFESSGGCPIIEMSMTNSLEKLEAKVSAWHQISVHPHRFGGREFRFGSAEVGHVHNGGVVDIPFPRSIRDRLLAEGLAEEHRWVPNSGWMTFHVRGEEDLRHAVWLMRLSYLRYGARRSTTRLLLQTQIYNYRLLESLRDGDWRVRLSQ
jgi:Family of unknown function (DUF5519)